MVETLDGCAEFDERLIDNAFAPSPDAALDRHLVSCARCRAARERYLATADALGGALSGPLEGTPSSRRGTAVAARPRRTRLRRLVLAACGVAAAVLAFLLVSRLLEPRITIETVEGEVNFGENSGRIRIDRGTARFLVERGPLAVETPLGIARCDEGEFTLAVAEEKVPMNRKQTTLAVAITVASGIVWWAADGQEVPVDATAPWVEREASESPDASPDLAGLDTAGQAPSAERRAGVPVGPTLDPMPAPVDPVPSGADPVFEILGRVVDGETGEPLAGASVTLGERRADRRAFAAVGWSGEDGRFRSSSGAWPAGARIRPGSSLDHFLVATFFGASAEGYAPVFEVPWKRFDAGSPLEAKEPIDLGEIRLFRGAEIRGRVVDERGAPVADAALLLAADAHMGSSFFPGTAEELARSGADGTFALERRLAPAATYTEHHLFAVSPGGIGWAKLDVLQAKAELPDVEVRIGAPGRLEVLVLDESGQPIEGADVRVEPRFAPLVPPRFDRPHDHTMFFGVRPDLWRIFIAETDARGRARFEHLPVPESGGGYDVAVAAKGFARGCKDEVLVLSSRDTNAVVVLETYRARTVSGTVRSADGLPVAGAELRTLSEGAWIDAITDDSGTYRLEGLDPAPEWMWLILTAPGFVKIERSVTLPVLGPARSAARGDVEGFDFVLERPRPIAGRVVDQDGQPVAGARPHLFREGDWRRLRGEQGRTGEDGTFRFDDATAGTWTLQVQPPEPASEWMAPFPNTQVEAGDTSIEFVLERAGNEGARVVARIVDAESGESLDPVAAQLLPVGPWPEGSRRSLPSVSRAAGSAIAETVDPGSWRMWVRVEGRATAFADLEVPAGEREVAVRIEVRATGILSGRVLFDGRTPFRPLVVQAQAGASGVPTGPEWEGGDASVSSASLPVQADGSFRIERATPGKWWLSIRGGGLLGGTSIDVPGGGEGRGEIRPIAGGRVVFRGNDAAPKGGMRVTARVAEGDSGNDTYVQYVTVEEGKVFEHDATVWAGDVRWNVEFSALDHPQWKPSDGLALPQSGSLRVAPGDVMHIPVPIVLRD